jgi:hypothetical protein
VIVSDEQRIEALADRIVERLRARPALFYDLLVEFSDAEYRDLLRAWGRVRERIALERDEHGHYLLPGSQATAAPAGGQPSPSSDGM